jgi:hypothetical protein
MGKGDFRIDFFRVEDLGGRDFPAVFPQAPEKAGLVAQLAGAPQARPGVAAGAAAAS